MSVTWGIHNEHPSLDLLGNQMVTVGWDEAGDIRKLGSDRAAIKVELAQRYPDAKAGAIPIWAGVLYRFAYEMQVGDLVIWPNKEDSTLNFGRIAGDYEHHPEAPLQRSRRRVEWIKTAVPRAQFSQGALYEVGSAVTLFKVKAHEAEFLAFLGAPKTTASTPVVLPDDVSDDVATTTAEAEPSAERIETHSRDFIVNALMTGLTGVQFEHFVAHLLRKMGYRTQVTQASGDGGYDVIAHRDPLGLEPPIIKVQCKRTINAIGGPDVQKLTGTLAPGGNELGLFVTLGSYTPEARNFGRNRQDLRLVTGPELVDLIFEHYDAFESEWKRLIPLRRVYVVDREPEAG